VSPAARVSCPAPRLFAADASPRTLDELLIPGTDTAFFTGAALPDGSFRVLHADLDWRRLMMWRVELP
jgi:hypothetical protein